MTIGELRKFLENLPADETTNVLSFMRPSGRKLRGYDVWFTINLGTAAEPANPSEGRGWGS
jgi:hypothetical protein